MTNTTNNQNERMQALAQHLGLKGEEIEELQPSSYDEKTIEYGQKDYLVVTDEEADELWDEELDNYVDECVLPEIPEHLRYYFDIEGWKADAKYDGRAHALNRYNGGEEWEKIGETEYYIYRQN